MDMSMVGQLAALRRLSVSELRGEWLRLYGEPTRSTNRDFLFKRLAWRVQELAHGGLSERAEQRLAELAPDDFIRAASPNVALPGDDLAPPVQRKKPSCDRRLSPGTVITKQYRGNELRVVVREDGFEYDGAMFSSLTGVAKRVSGCRSINGRLFFGLSTRKRS